MNALFEGQQAREGMLLIINGQIVKDIDLSILRDGKWDLYRKQSLGDSGLHRLMLRRYKSVMTKVTRSNKWCVSDWRGVTYCFKK